MSRNPERYCNRFGVRPVVAGDMSIITLDGDEHIRQRRLVNPGFTPRRVRELVPHIRELSQQLIDDDRGQGLGRLRRGLRDPRAAHHHLRAAGPRPRAAHEDVPLVRRDDGRRRPLRRRLARAPRRGHRVRRVRRAAPRPDRGAPRRPDRRRPHRPPHAGVRQRRARQGARSRCRACREERIAEILAERGELSDEELFAFLTILLVAGNETTRNAHLRRAARAQPLPRRAAAAGRPPRRRRVRRPRGRGAAALRLAGARLHPHRHRGPHLPRTPSSRRATAS